MQDAPDHLQEQTAMQISAIKQIRIRYSPQGNHSLGEPEKICKSSPA